MTVEEIRSADNEVCELRLKELRDATASADAETLNAIKTEINAISERMNELKAAEEERSAIAQTVAGGAGKTERNFESEEEKMTYTVDSPEYRSAWLKNLQHKPINEEERAALSHGEYAIPTETLNRIYGKMELYPLLNAVEVMHFPGYVTVPVEGTVNDANVVAMGTASTDSADALAKVSLTAYKIIKTLEITADVENMAVPAFENWVVDRLGNKIFRKVAALVAAGTGSNQPTGLTGISATGNTYTAAGITYADLLTIIAAVPSEYLTNASFVMSRATFFQGVLGLETTTNYPVVVADRQAPAKYNILGYPVIIEDGIGTDVVFGDLKEGYVFNFGKDVTVDRDESVGFRTGSVVYRGMCLGDGKPTGVGLVRFTKASA